MWLVTRPMETREKWYVLPLGAVILFNPLNALAKLNPQWSVVQDVEPRSKIRVRLYDREAESRISGRLSSSTDKTVTITSKGGPTRTFEQQEVERVSVRRPFARHFWHPAAWIACGLTALGMKFHIDSDGNLNPDYTGALIAGAIAWGITVGLCPSYKTIYNVSKKHRKSIRSGTSSANN